MNDHHRPLSRQVAARFTVDAQPWLSCDDCFHLVDQYVERLLDGDADAMPAMRAHLRGCSACREEAESLIALLAEDRRQDPGPALHAL